MTERTVKVSLVANATNYVAGMERAAIAARGAATEGERLAAQRAGFESLGRSALVFGAVAAAGVAIAIRKFAEFDEAVSQVSAVTQESTANMALLRDAALEAGGVTRYSATEAANAIEELGKAGISTADILSGALSGSLSLAASDNLEVARAAEITATTLKQFNLAGTEAGHVADVLAAGAGKALGGVEDLAQALKFVGPVAGSMGISLEDVTATLALFADQGIIGEQAGSALRGMLASLQNPSKEASAKLKDLQINLYDANGAFVGLGSVVEQLNSKLGDADDQTRDTALGLIFTNAQLTTAQTLVGDAGAKWGEYRTAVDDAGYASRIAADRMNNLNGDIEKLGGAFDTALIQTGSGANDVLRDIVQTLTFLVDGFAGLPGPVIEATLALGGSAAAVGLVGGSALVATPRIAEFKKTLGDLGITGRSAAIGISAATGALAAATFVITAIAQDAADRSQTVDSFKESLEATTGAVTNYTRELIAQRLETEGAIKVGKDLGLGTEELVDLALQGKGAIEKYADAQRTANAENAATVTQYDTVTGALTVVADQLDQGRTAWQLNRDATESSRKATQDNENALASLRGEAASTGDEIDDLANKIRGFGSATLDVRDAQRQFQSAIDDAAAALEANGATLDTNTEEGRANEAALDDIATSALEAAAAIYDKTKSEEEATAAVAAGRQALIDQLGQYGITGQAAEDYADSLGLIPSNINTVVEVDTITASKAIDGFLSLYNGTRVQVIVDATGGTSYQIPNTTVRFNETGGFYNRGVQAFESGGFPSGVYAGGQNIHKFAETGLPWETYISPKPGHERENIGYALESLARLGFNGYAQGGGTQQVATESGRPITIKQEFHPVPGMSDAAIANISSSDLLFELGRQG